MADGFRFNPSGGGSQFNPQYNPSLPDIPQSNYTPTTDPQAGSGTRTTGTPWDARAASNLPGMDYYNQILNRGDGYMSPQDNEMLGLIGAQYGFDTNSATDLYGINRSQAETQNNIIRSQGQDIQYDINGKRIDNDYRQYLAGSYGNDLGLYNNDLGSYKMDQQSFDADRVGLGAELSNQLAGLQRQAAMDQFNNKNQAVAGGAWGSPGRMIRKANINDTLAQGSTAATLNNQQANRALDRSYNAVGRNINNTGRSMNDTDRSIAGQNNAISQNNVDIDKLNNALNRNGMQVSLGNLGIDELTAQFNHKMGQLGINSKLDANKVFRDASSANAQERAQAQALLLQLGIIQQGV